MMIGLEEEEAMGLEEDWKGFEGGVERRGLLAMASSSDDKECSLSVAGMISLSSISF